MLLNIVVCVWLRASAGVDGVTDTKQLRIPEPWVLECLGVKEVLRTEAHYTWDISGYWMSCPCRAIDSHRHREHERDQDAL